MLTNTKITILTGTMLLALVFVLIFAAQYAKASSAPPLVIDVPQHWSEQSGIGLIHGWVCGGGQVEISIDGEPFSTLTADAPRWDVARAFPECGPSTGFAAAMNWGNLATGGHSLTVNGVEVLFHVGGFSGYLESDQVDFSKATLVPGLGGTFWLNGVMVAGRKTNLLYRWESSIQGLTVLSVEQIQDVPDTCGFSPPDPMCQY